MSNSSGLMAGQGNEGPSDLNLQHDIPGMQDFQHDSSCDLPLRLLFDETMDRNRQFSSSTVGYSIPDAVGVQRRTGASSHSSLDSFEQSNDGDAVGCTPPPQAALSPEDAWSKILQDLPFPVSLSVDLGNERGAALSDVPDADRSTDLVSSSDAPLINPYVRPSESIPPHTLMPLVVEPVGPVSHIQDLFWTGDSPDVYTATTAASPVPPLEHAVVPFGNSDAVNDLALHRSLAELFALESLREEVGDHHVRRYEFVAGYFLWNPFGIPNFGLVPLTVFSSGGFSCGHGGCVFWCMLTPWFFSWTTTQSFI